MIPLQYCTYLPYIGLVPFLVYTYQAWCGPIEELENFTRHFLLFSSATLIFISGSWWGVSYSRPGKIRSTMMLIGIGFGLLSALFLAFATDPVALVALGVLHVTIWLLEFMVPQIELEQHYKMQRTIVTMVTLVCHLLVATQYLF